jgi:hypothetical protein
MHERVKEAVVNTERRPCLDKFGQEDLVVSINYLGSE